jgi:hypothetical protein
MVELGLCGVPDGYSGLGSKSRESVGNFRSSPRTKLLFTSPSIFPPLNGEAFGGGKKYSYLALWTCVGAIPDP